MKKTVKRAFEDGTLTLPLDRILPTKKLGPTLRESVRYQAILASIAELGVIEPLVVFPDRDGAYLLLDGHVRLEALRERGATETTCLVSTDDETYTYNHKVNRVAPIQENRMILKAIEGGATEARIARALNMTTETVRRRRTMLNGICKEAVELLKDKPICLTTLNALRAVKPVRQVEVAELMNIMNTYTRSYMGALVAATPAEALVETQARRPPVARPEDLAKVERELHALEQSVFDVRESHSRNVMHLTLARTWLRSLLANAKVVTFLARKHPETLKLFQSIAELTALSA